MRQVVQFRNLFSSQLVVPRAAWRCPRVRGGALQGSVLLRSLSPWSWEGSSKGSGWAAWGKLHPGCSSLRGRLKATGHCGLAWDLAALP